VNIPSEVVWALVGFLVVLILRGHLVLSEFSLINLRYSNLDEDTLKKLRKSKRIAIIFDSLQRVGEVIRLGRKLCSLATGGLLYLLFRLLNGYTNMWMPVIFAVLFGALVQVLISDLIPRFLAGKDPIGVLRRGSWAIYLFWITGWPLLKIQDWVKEVLKKWTQHDTGDALNPLDVEVQLRAMGDESTSIPPIVRKILMQTLQFDDLVVQDIILPRNQVVILDAKKTFAENLEVSRKAGHTRYPLCEGDLDHCMGIIHIKDIFRFRADWDRINLFSLKRPAISFSNEETLAEVLPKMLRNKVHMALAKDEFGGVVGVVTLEKILEIMVGEIQDEFDQEEHLIRDLGRNTWHISGLAPLHDLEERLGLPPVEEDDVSTFGGLIISSIGRIPKPKETATFRNLKVRILEADDLRVKFAEVQKLETTDDQ
jgi:CBS domain containing-hemolysin-like protein